jgi:hypothetical protein
MEPNPFDIILDELSMLRGLVGNLRSDNMRLQEQIAEAAKEIQSLKKMLVELEEDGE